MKSPAAQLYGCPFRPLAPKGGARFRGQGRLACGSPRGIEDAIRGSRLPARSALNGAHRAPAPPDEGSCVPVARVQDRPERKRRLLEKHPTGMFFVSFLRFLTLERPWGFAPNPTAFEKAGKTFPSHRPLVGGMSSGPDPGTGGWLAWMQ